MYTIERIFFRILGLVLSISGLYVLAMHPIQLTGAAVGIPLSDNASLAGFALLLVSVPFYVATYWHRP